MADASPGMTRLQRISRRLARRAGDLPFGPPVRYVYNPLEYAWKSYRAYLRRYGERPREVVFVGMNPGPWGMVQTGVPFGEVDVVRDWLRIEEPVGRPRREHPRRRVEGFSCRRREVSGARFWGWVRASYGSPGRFFRTFFVLNYCPLCFFDAAGRNVTPEKLSAADRARLCAVCDEALAEALEALRPRVVIGVGAFAEKQALQVLRGTRVRVGRIPHPSPASPIANRGWEERVRTALAGLDIASRGP